MYLIYWEKIRNTYQSTPYSVYYKRYMTSLNLDSYEEALCLYGQPLPNIINIARITTAHKVVKYCWAFVPL